MVQILGGEFHDGALSEYRERVGCVGQACPGLADPSILRREVLAQHPLEFA
ncbi:MAG: hypothetical protein ACFHWZ_12325 [Phycisphaerales bacterium]